MSRRITSLPIFILLFLCLLAERNLGEAISCSTKERKALLKFKEGLNDTSNCLSSWIGKNCCNWLGVGCSNKTGHVIKLDLHGRIFSPVEEGNKTSPSCAYLALCGKVSPSLLDLKYLTYLDLSDNNFQGIHVPNFIGSLTNLRYLDLSQSSFSGMIPPTLGNLSNLRHLDLRTLQTFTHPLTLWVSDLHWLPKLSSLEYPNLGGVNLSKATTYWLQAVNMLPSLLELHLPSSELSIFPQHLPFVNFTSLQVLHLGSNNFSSLIPPWIFNVSTLEELDLYTCEIEGNIPQVARGNLCSLQILDLSCNSITGEINEFIDALSECNNSSFRWLDFSNNKLRGNLPSTLGVFPYLEQLQLSRNSFSGSIPISIGNLSRLSTLDLSFNVLSGVIPESIGQLTYLDELSLSDNSWKGIISDIHLQNLTRLIRSSISSENNSLVFIMKHGWIPPFNLQSLEIDDCRLGPTFPAWLRTQTSLDTIILRRSCISAVIPNWFWKLSSGVRWLDLSNNQLSGVLPNSTYLPAGAWVILGVNHLEGSIPIWPNVTYLSLRKNLLSGPIPSNIGQKMSQLVLLDLSGNFLNGGIPFSIREMRNIITLDISSNNLSGELFEQWMGLENFGSWICPTTIFRVAFQAQYAHNFLDCSG